MIKELAPHAAACAAFLRHLPGREGLFRRRLLPSTACLLFALPALLVAQAVAAPYQDAVKNLQPSFYYELNETTADNGVIDSMGHAAPGSYNGDYITSGPGGPGPLEVFGGIAVPGVGGSANIAHYSNNVRHILLGPAANYGANDITVAFFMHAGPSAGGDRLFTNNLNDPTQSFQVNCGNDGLVVGVDPSQTGFAAERTLYLEDNSDRDRRLINSGNGWFHIVVSTHGTTGPDRAANIKVWVNGVNRTANLQPDATGWAVETEFAKIGGRGSDPLAPQTHSGAQDEMAIWLNRVLTDAEVATLWAAARRGRNATGLNGWWPFEGNVSEVSGKGLLSAPMGSPSFEPDVPAGLSGQSVRFHPAAPGEGVKITDAPPIDIDQFTLGYFINLKGVAPGSSGLERLSARENYNFETAIGDAHVLPGGPSPVGTTLSYYQGGWTVTNVPFPVDGWMHVAWRNTAVDMQLFLNGVSVFTGPPVPAGRARGFMNFGTAFNNVENFTGLMDDAFLWDGTLTPEQIAGIAASGIANYTGITTDSDGDALPDWWEIQYGLNAGDDGTVLAVNGPAADPDNDGLPNAQEFQRGTNPKDNDSDDDGLTDGNEVTRNTNPTLADTDGDGLNDGAEITRGTNPLDADSDDDSVSDGDEVAAGTNPLDPLSGPPPSTFLVLHLNLDGNATDSSPLHNNGTVLNNATFVDDAAIPGGKAISVPNGGVNTVAVQGSGINIPGNASISSSTFTLAYWVKPTALQENAGVERLTSRGGDLFETAIGNRSGVGGAADPQTLSYFFGAWQNTATALPMNQWSHVTWRNKGNGAQDFTLFVNGVLAYTGAGMPAGRLATSLMRVGTRHNGLEGFQGLMDDVRLYKAPLQDSDIFTISQATPPLPLDFTSMVRSPNGSSVTLTIQSRPGRTYAIDFSTAMTPSGQPGGWVELTDSLPSTGAQTIYTDTVASNLLRAYYRARDVTP